MRFLKRLYDWVLHWANTPYGIPALFLLAFAESSFFPIPPDVLLIALSLSIPKKAFKYAAVCTIGSVLGGVLGYLLGWQFWELAKGILFKYIDPAGFEIVRNYFIKYEAWAVSIAGFTPIPYKVFTISAGFLRADFMVFFIASVFSRGARFFLVSLLIFHFGPSIRSFIDRYFNVLTFVFMALLLGGFLAVRHFF
ncbi:MAG: VTT domain-containing protein [Nitrospinae bacterium]|nr:VTT domain-containing protein [Nitrospinota bacterium]